MSAERTSPATTVSSSAASVAKRRGRPPRSSAPARATASLEAKRRATAILEVLAGARRPSEAAAALSVTVPRYYLLEQQALRGLLAACELRTLAGPRPETRLAQLEKQLAVAQRECARQQALVRAAQRTVGLAAPPAKPASAGKTAGNGAKTGKSHRHRRPTVRALRAVRELWGDSPGQPPEEALQPAASPAPSALGRGKET